MKNNIPQELSNAAGIYEIRNLVDGKVYVGSTICMKKRYKEHFNDLKANRHYNRFLQAAYNKYGTDSFIFSRLVHLDAVPNETKKGISIRLMDAENREIVAAQSINRKYGYNLASFEVSDKGNLTCRFPRECRQGEKHHQSTLTNQDVLTIIKLFSEGKSYSELVTQFGVRRNILYNIVRGVSWSAVTGIDPHKRGMPKGVSNPNAKLDNQTVIKILELTKEGVSARAISDRLNISYDLISGIRRGKSWTSVTNLNAKEAKKPPLLTNEQLLSIKEMLMSGISCSEIARNYGVYCTLISSVKRGIYGAEITGFKPGQLPTKKVLNQDEKDTIIILLKSGAGVNELAQQFGTHATVISRIKKKIPSNEVSKFKGSMTPNQRNVVLTLLGTGIGITEIGRRFGVSHSAISLIKKQAMI